MHLNYHLGDDRIFALVSVALTVGFAVLVVVLVVVNTPAIPAEPVRIRPNVVVIDGYGRIVTLPTGERVFIGNDWAVVLPALKPEGR